MGQVVHENIFECASSWTYAGLCLVTNLPSYELDHMDMIVDFGNLRGKKIPLHYLNLNNIHVPNK